MFLLLTKDRQSFYKHLGFTVENVVKTVQGIL